MKKEKGKIKYKTKERKQKEGKGEMKKQIMEKGLKECENVIDIAKIVHCVGVLGMGEDGAIVCNLHTQLMHSPAEKTKNNLTPSNTSLTAQSD